MDNRTTPTFGNQTLQNNTNLCTLKTCTLQLAQVQYVCNLAGNSLFLAIFAAVIIAQLVLGYLKKTWPFTIVMICGLILEVLGYLGRILLHNTPFSRNDFLLELICLTIAPAFLTAGIYLCLGRIVVLYGSNNSRISPRTYTIIFCACDIFSLILQAIGGGITASADRGSSNVQTGTNILIAGLAFQVFSLVLFALLCAEFAWRLRSKSATRNEKYLSLVHSNRFKAFLWALTLAAVTIFVRCVYRVIELQDGFGGALANNQVIFMILEGTMIIIAVLALTAFHPGIGFQGHWQEAKYPWKASSAGEKSRPDSYASTTMAETSM